MFGKIESKTKKGERVKKNSRPTLGGVGEKGIEIYVPPSPVFPKRTKEEGTKKVFREKVAEEPIDIRGRMRYVAREREGHNQ